MDSSPPRPPDKPTERMDVDELAAAVRYHNWRYFSLAAPEISDYAFDRLTRRLAELAPEHPALAELTPGEATGEKVFHDAPMLSLDKCYEEQELLEWAESFDGPAIETPKIDGVAASLKYGADGRLSLAITRGDGTRGEAFVANARYIEAIPKQLVGPPLTGPVEVRGEIYMPLSVFATMADTFSNPRNTTAGAMKLKDPAATAAYGLAFFVYDVIGPDFATEMDKVAWSTAHGLPAVETRLVTPEEMQAGYDAWLARRSGADFELDGVVYKADDLAEQARLGATSHHPRYAIAYKFQGDSGTSTLLRVDWSVSRTGTITPVAIIEPVELSGAMVSRCSLHNLSILRQLDVTLGATVVAMRRGGVIPHIEQVTEPGDRPVEIPERCPACGSPTRTRADFLECSRPFACPAAIQGTLAHFVKTAGIDGFGPKVLAQLFERGLLQQPADFYGLAVADLLPLERMGDTLAAKLVANVQGARQLTLPRFLQALGVDKLGASVALSLAQRFRSLDALLAATEEELQDIDGVAGEIATSTLEGLAARADLIAALREVVTVEDHVPATVILDGHGVAPLADRSFVFTGALATMDRKRAQQLVRQRGGATPSSVSGALDYLVVGDKGSPLLGEGKASSKQKKAEKLVAGGARIQIITEAAFLEMIGPG